MARFAQVLQLALVLVLLAGCSVWRGMPTHGGGKRFDEEQRIVSGAIRRAAADMNLEDLKGHTVQIVVDAMSHNGGGYQTFPGLQSINGNYSKSVGTNIMNYAPFTTPPPGYYSSAQDYKTYNDSQNYGVSGSYQPSMTYSAAQFGSDADVTYLMSVLGMKGRHSGLMVVPANPEYVLYVLVDVLGMNRSRRDNLIFWRDKMTATCELTYYAVRVADNQMLFRARQAKATGLYAEDSLLAFNAFHVTRDLQSKAPDFLPVDSSISTVTLAQLDDSAKPVTAVASTTPALPTATAEKFGTQDAAVLEFASSRLRDADAQIRQGNLQLARYNISAVRAVAPNFPGLIDLELRLRAAHEQIRSQALARAVPAPLPMPVPVVQPQPTSPGALAKK